ncbi:LysR family transcriptional regulator [bacterium]|nr:LysR family transcriptional regulator [bacterium]
MRGSEYAELGAFIAIADTGGFAKASRQLGIAPSTLSQTIRSLEDRLGIRLFHRTTRSVSLTEAGERLLGRIRPAFAEVQSAVDSISYFRDTPTGTLRLSISTIPAQMIIAPMLKGFMEAYPAITLDIEVNNNIRDIVSGRFDAGIHYGRRIAQDMVVVRASPESRVIAVASPAYLATHGTPQTPQDLQRHACIRFRRGDESQPMHWEFERHKKKVEIAVDGPLIVNDVGLMMQAARDGLGIAYMVEAYIREDIARGILVPLLLDWSSAHHSYYLYYASRHQLPVPLKLFSEFLKAASS